MCRQRCGSWALTVDSAPKPYVKNALASTKLPEDSKLREYKFEPVALHGPHSANRQPWWQEVSAWRLGSTQHRTEALHCLCAACFSTVHGRRIGRQRCPTQRQRGYRYRNDSRSHDPLLPCPGRTVPVLRLDAPQHECASYPSQHSSPRSWQLGHGAVWLRGSPWGI